MTMAKNEAKAGSATKREAPWSGQTKKGKILWYVISHKKIYTDEINNTFKNINIISSVPIFVLQLL